MKKINISNVVLGLICFVNFLNLFIPRYAFEEGGGSASYAVRLPIQLSYIAITFIMGVYIMFYKEQAVSGFLRSLYAFILLVGGYLAYSYVAPQYPIIPYAQYIKLLGWLIAIIFFIRYFDHTNRMSRKLAMLYVYIFLIVAAKKMIEIRMVVGEREGGDTIGLTIALAIPAILFFFDKNMKIIMLVFACLLIMLSVRRTAIIALGMCFPFIYTEIRSKLKTYHIVLAGIGLAAAVFYAWGFLGAQLANRFAQMINGDEGGSNGYGSGRTIFYLITYNGWKDGTPLQIIFGHGAGGVKDLLKRKYTDIGHTHNDFLEILYTYGLFGMAIWSWIIYQLFKIRKLIKTYNPNRLRLHTISMISFLTIAGLSGTMFKIDMLAFSLSTGVIVSEALKNRKMVQMLSKAMEVSNNDIPEIPRSSAQPI